VVLRHQLHALPLRGSRVRWPRTHELEGLHLGGRLG
jgi:hypothetical protein